jgi:hypothetical protein
MSNYCLSLMPNQEDTEMTMAVSTAPSSKAAQACVPCRKQKRKCDKSLPSCGLCSRMGRSCDYTDVQQAPTAEDLVSMQMKIIELEERLNQKNQQESVNSSSGMNTLNGSLGPGPSAFFTKAVGEKPPLWMPAQSKFPSAMFLDIDCFTYAALPIPKPSAEIPLVRSPFLILLGFREIKCMRYGNMHDNHVSSIAYTSGNFLYPTNNWIGRPRDSQQCKRTPTSSYRLLQYGPLLDAHHLQEAHEPRPPFVGGWPGPGNAVPRHETSVFSTCERGCQFRRPCLHCLQEVPRPSRVQRHHFHSLPAGHDARGHLRDGPLHLSRRLDDGSCLLTVC